jgi:hypothetical protein
VLHQESAFTGNSTSEVLKPGGGSGSGWERQNRNQKHQRSPCREKTKPGHISAASTPNEAPESRTREQVRQVRMRSCARKIASTMEPRPPWSAAVEKQFRNIVQYNEMSLAYRSNTIRIGVNKTTLEGGAPRAVKRSAAERRARRRSSREQLVRRCDEGSDVQLTDWCDRARSQEADAHRLVVVGE